MHLVLSPHLACRHNSPCETIPQNRQILIQEMWTAVLQGQDLNLSRSALTVQNHWGPVSLHLFPGWLPSQPLYPENLKTKIELMIPADKSLILGWILFDPVFKSHMSRALLWTSFLLQKQFKAFWEHGSQNQTWKMPQTHVKILNFSPEMPTVAFIACQATPLQI